MLPHRHRSTIAPLLFATLALLLTASLPGCQRLNFTAKADLAPLGIKGYDFDPPAYEQKVMVTVTPTECGVSSYLIKKADYEAVVAALDREKEPAAGLLLGKWVSVGPQAEAYSFEATVPPKTAYMLVLKNGKKRNDVSLKVAGR